MSKPINVHKQPAAPDHSMSTQPVTTFLSLGAGVQSAALLLMSIDGHLPPIRHAVHHGHRIGNPARCTSTSAGSRSRWLTLASPSPRQPRGTFAATHSTRRTASRVCRCS